MVFSRYFRESTFNIGALIRNLRTLGEMVEMVYLTRLFAQQARVPAFDPKKLC